jgi:hypothetical protein
MRKLVDVRANSDRVAASLDDRRPACEVRASLAALRRQFGLSAAWGFSDENSDEAELVERAFDYEFLIADVADRELDARQSGDIRLEMAEAAKGAALREEADALLREADWESLGSGLESFEQIERDTERLSKSLNPLECRASVG